VKDAVDIYIHAGVESCSHHELYTCLALNLCQAVGVLCHSSSCVQRPHERGRGERVGQIVIVRIRLRGTKSGTAHQQIKFAQTSRRVHLNKARHKGIVDTLMDDEAAQRRAALARRAHSPEDGGAQCEVNIRVRHDHSRVVAPEFEDGAPKAPVNDL